MGQTGGVEGYGPSTYGDAFADVYDDWYAGTGDVDGLVDAVARRALAVPGDARGRVLELGVGTGRLAVRLAAAGLAVTGVDASERMLERLRTRPDADGVVAVLGDMSESLPAGPWAVVLCAANTLFNLTTAEAQERCLRLVAAVLAPDGLLAVEAFVPDDSPEPSRAVEVRSIGLDRVVLSVSERLPATRTAAGHMVELSDGGVRLRPWKIRWATPAELDALAGGAGLELVDRFGGWRDEPFGPRCDTHVSWYRRCR